MRYKSVEFLDEMEISDTIRESIKNNSWYFKNKLKSPVMYEVLRVKTQLEAINISCENAIDVICLLNYMTPADLFYNIPDRLLTEFVQVSRSRIKDIICILSKTEILKAKILFGQIKYNMNKRFVAGDPYIQLKSQKIYARYDNIRRLLSARCGSFYWDPYCDSTIHKHIRELIIGVSLAYTKNYVEPKYKKLNEDASDEGRTDIFYLEVPYKILCPLLNMTPRELQRKLKIYCKRTGYMMSHDQVYIDGSCEHYINPVGYKRCPLNSYAEIDMNNRRPVNKWSYILSLDAFNSSNTCTSISKHQNYYNSIIDHSLEEYLSIDVDDTAVGTIRTEKELRVSVKSTNPIFSSITENVNSVFGKDTYTVTDRHKINQSTTDKYRQYIRLKVPDVYKLTVTQIQKYMQKIADKFIKYDDVRDKDLKFYIEKYNLLQNRLNELTC